MNDIPQTKGLVKEIKMIEFIKNIGNDSYKLGHFQMYDADISYEITAASQTTLKNNYRNHIGNT